MKWPWRKRQDRVAAVERCLVKTWTELDRQEDMIADLCARVAKLEGKDVQRMSLDGLNRQITDALIAVYKGDGDDDL